MSPKQALDERDVLVLHRKFTPNSVGGLGDSDKWTGGSTNGERRFLDATEQALLDQLDVQVQTRDTLLAELESAGDRRSRALRDYELAQKRVRDAELVARGTREGFEVLAKRNVPRPDGWTK